MSDAVLSEDALRQALSGMDIMLIDQLLRGRLPAGRRIVDMGCGSGRNLDYFLRRGDQVIGVDQDAGMIEHCRTQYGDRGEWHCAAIEACAVPAEAADVLICNAVLHFARDEAHFSKMLAACWRCLAPGGMFFARLASRIGLPPQVPPGGFTYLVDMQELERRTEALGAQLLDPIKTSNVHNQRCMTTWVLAK